MTVKYIPETKEYIIESAGKKYSVCRFGGQYDVEEIDMETDDLRYVGSYDTLGEVLVKLVEAEIEENSKEV